MNSERTKSKTKAAWPGLRAPTSGKDDVAQAIAGAMRQRDRHVLEAPLPHRLKALLEEIDRQEGGAR